MKAPDAPSAALASTKTSRQLLPKNPEKTPKSKHGSSYILQTADVKPKTNIIVNNGTGSLKIARAKRRIKSINLIPIIITHLHTVPAEIQKHNLIRSNTSAHRITDQLHTRKNIITLRPHQLGRSNRSSRRAQIKPLADKCTHSLHALQTKSSLQG